MKIKEKKRKEKNTKYKEKEGRDIILWGESRKLTFRHYIDTHTHTYICNIHKHTFIYTKFVMYVLLSKGDANVLETSRRAWCIRQSTEKKGKRFGTSIHVRE